MPKRASLLWRVLILLEAKSLQSECFCEPASGIKIRKTGLTQAETERGSRTWLH